MRDYLKILSTIIAALLSLAAFASVVIGVHAAVTDSPNIAGVMAVPFAIVWAGFVMFGIVGSVFWYAFLVALSTRNLSPLKRHSLAAALAVIATFLAVALAFSQGKLAVIKEAAPVLIIVVPVVAISLFWYWFLYLRLRPRQSNKNALQ